MTQRQKFIAETILNYIKTVHDGSHGFINGYKIEWLDTTEFDCQDFAIYIDNVVGHSF